MRYLVSLFLASMVALTFGCLHQTTRSLHPSQEGRQPIAGQSQSQSGKDNDWEEHFIPDMGDCEMLVGLWQETRLDALDDTILVCREPNAELVRMGKQTTHYLVVKKEIGSSRLVKLGSFERELSAWDVLLLPDGIVAVEDIVGYGAGTAHLRKFSFAGRLLAQAKWPGTAPSATYVARIGSRELMVFDGAKFHLLDSRLRTIRVMGAPKPPQGHKWMGTFWGSPDGDLLYLWSAQGCAANITPSANTDVVPPAETYFVSKYDISRERILATVPVRNDLEAYALKNTGYPDVPAYYDMVIKAVVRHNLVFPSSGRFYQLDLRFVLEGEDASYALPIVSEHKWQPVETREFNPHPIMARLGRLHRLSNLAIMGESPVIAVLDREFYEWPGVSHFGVFEVRFATDAPGQRDDLVEVARFDDR